jgi:hypothetical protein
VCLQSWLAIEGFWESIKPLICALDRRYRRSRSTASSTLKNFNPIKWWDGNETVYQTLHLWALDILSIPAMATECERAFSSAEKLFTPERNALADATIGATECLKALTQAYQTGLPNRPGHPSACVVRPVQSTVSDVRVFIPKRSHYNGRIYHGYTSHECTSRRQVSCRRVSHRRASHWRASHGWVCISWAGVSWACITECSRFT